MKKITILSTLVFSIFLTYAQQMNNTKLQSVLVAYCDSIVGQPGYWQMNVKGVPMLCITDEHHNRMRIISPVKTVQELHDGELKKALEANFHSALDVRYSISEELVWVAFIHPLAELTEDQVKSAIAQVYYAQVSFGKEYSSGYLSFPTTKEREETEREQKKKEKKSKTKKL